MKITKAKIILAIFVLVAILGGYFLINKFWMLENDNKVQNVEAARFFPFYFGGVVSAPLQFCIADPITGVCSNCPFCTGLVGNYTCAGFQEIQFAPFFTTGPNFLCLTKGILPIGVFPVPGVYIVGGGVSNINTAPLYTSFWGL